MSGFAGRVAAASIAFSNRHNPSPSSSSTSPPPIAEKPSSFSSVRVRVLPLIHRLDCGWVLISEFSKNSERSTHRPQRTYLAHCAVPPPPPKLPLPLPFKHQHPHLQHGRTIPTSRRHRPGIIRRRHHLSDNSQRKRRKRRKSSKGSGQMSCMIMIQGCVLQIYAFLGG